MTIKRVVEYQNEFGHHITEECDSGFGFFYDKELTRPVDGMYESVIMTGEPRIKKIKLYFGNPNKWDGPLESIDDNPIVISSSTNPEENVILGQRLRSGVENAVGMWFSLNRIKSIKGEAWKGDTEISITTVCWRSHTNGRQ